MPSRPSQGPVCTSDLDSNITKSFEILYLGLNVKKVYKIVFEHRSVAHQEIHLPERRWTRYNSFWGILWAHPF
jgi:hypothetical protein